MSSELVICFISILFLGSVLFLTFFVIEKKKRFKPLSEKQFKHFLKGSQYLFRVLDSQFVSDRGIYRFCLEYAKHVTKKSVTCITGYSVLKIVCVETHTDVVPKNLIGTYISFQFSDRAFLATQYNSKGVEGMIIT